MDSLSSGSFLQSGKYKIIKALGQGGFGITYLAEQVALGRKVAIKEFFMKDYCDRENGTSHVSVPTGNSLDLVNSYKQKFVKEAQMIASLRSPHIVSIYDIFEENGTAYYVMEYLNNGSLVDVVKQSGPLPETEAIRYIAQVGDALSYIHDRNILHLDVKPSNILLNDDGKVVLIDFGISKHYDETGGQTSTTPVGISKGYAPMEQYQQGSVTKFSPATDVYSLGATLFFLLTSNTPPEAAEVYEDGLPDLGHTISNATKDAINKAMAPKRKERLQSVAAFLDLLNNESGLSEETIVSGHDTDPVVSRQDESTVLVPESSNNGKLPNSSNDLTNSRKQNKAISIFAVLGIFAFILLGMAFLNKRYKITEANDPKGRATTETTAVIYLNGKSEIKVEFSEKGGKESLTFYKTFSDEWTYTSNQGWCRIEHTDSPDQITVLCDENTSTEYRIATIHFFKSGDSNPLARLSINQSGVEVIKATSVTLKDGMIKLQVGEKHTIRRTVYPSNAEPNSVKWSSSNTDIAAVSTDGVITARGIGLTFITAKAENSSSSCTVEVMNKTPTIGSIKVSSEPTGAAIWIDGKDTKKTTPATLQEITAGDHVVRLLFNGYEDYSGKVNVVPGQQIIVTQTLTRKVTNSSSSVRTSNSTVSSANNKATTGTINGHEWVDLGLSVKWATCNVGAYSPSDFGRYFSWSSSDIARSNWGGTWRTPTEAEFKELQTKCDWTWTTQGCKYGMKVTSKGNGKSIFLPAAGMLENKDTPGVSSYYWSSSQCVGYSDYSWALYFDRRHEIRIDDYKRGYSFTIRPVTN